MSNKAHQIITNKIIDVFESGMVPWHMPWVNGMPKSIHGHKYRGPNMFILQATASKNEYAANIWATYNQVKKRSGYIREGEKGTIVVSWKWTTKENGNGEEITFPILRRFTVFNVEQCESIDYAVPKLPDKFTAIEQADNVVNGMLNKPKIKHDGARAYYWPIRDIINMSDKKMFENSDEYYTTLFHELIHSTGHKSRLDRSFGGEKYSKEELVAEMGASMLCGTVGIDTTINNSAAYISGWLKVFKNDNKIIVCASAQAQKAADYIQGVLMTS